MYKIKQFYENQLEVNDDELILPIAMMGAPTVMMEKFPSGNEFTQLVSMMEKLMQKKVSAILCIEAGGLNSTIPFVAAAKLGLPIVDGDAMGRAFPELQMCTFGVYGVNCSPVIVRDEKDNEIKELAKNTKNVDKFSTPVDETYEFIFEKYGPVLRYKTEDDKYAYKNIKKELQVTLQDIKNKKYTAEELIEENNQCIGVYQDHEVFVKIGRYGAYVEWNDQKKTLKNVNKTVSEITLEDVIQVLNDEVQDKNVLRALNANLSIRKGKFGPYIYYKAPQSTKPQFFNIKKYQMKLFHFIQKRLLKVEIFS